MNTDIKPTAWTSCPDAEAWADWADAAADSAADAAWAAAESDADAPSVSE